jgi:hypothetical protein
MTGAWDVFFAHSSRFSSPTSVQSLSMLNRRAVVVVLQLVEVTHTNLTEVTRVILVHHDSVMVLTTSHTAASRVLAVLTDAAVTGGHVAALYAVLVQLRAGKHRDSTVSTHTLTPSRV